MPINRDQVLHIAALSRLALDAGEIEKYQKELDAILEYVDQLSKVETRGVPLSTHAGADAQSFREDRAESFGNPIETLKNAPRREGTFVVVPKVI